MTIRPEKVVRLDFLGAAPLKFEPVNYAAINIATEKRVL